MIESNKLSDTNDHSLDKSYHATVKKVTKDIESLNLNTAISQMMIFINDAYKAETLYKEYAEGFIKMLSCFAPHLCEEMWELLGHNESLTYEAWPTYDESFLVEANVEIVVQVNGKLRGKFTIAKDASEDAIKEEALALKTVQAQIEGKTIRKFIIIKGKIVNIVAN